ncbi:hypothetical protein AVEN_32034-1 [Araneus ventricosus]|uniref:Uncharacterized protein n=1 Tax=Araneus ventricosus TaxID=182803 RepID=A0A4Y2JTA9_ARAVE|nr:hypothetical protein AVEN_32034-1 [Araneus ventricosus]
MPLHPGHLNDSHCNCSSTGAGVLVSITGHGPTHPVGGTYYQLRRDPSPTITISTREERTRLLIQRLLIRELVVNPTRWDKSAMRWDNLVKDVLLLSTHGQQPGSACKTPESALFALFSSFFPV